MKTISLKKVSAVAVASLGFGLLSVAPAQAAAQTGDALTAINATKATANTNTTSAAQVFYVGGTIANNAAMADTEDQRIRAVATSYPTGGFIGVTGSTGAASLTFTGAAVTDTGTGNSVRVLATDDTTGGLAVASTGVNGLAAFSFTPTVAGTYAITIWNDIDDANDIDVSEAITTLTFTITAQPKISAGLSTVYINTADAAATSTTSLVPVRASKALGTAAVAALTVTLVDTLGAAITTVDGYTLSATVSGDAGGIGTTIEAAAAPTLAAQCPGTQPVRVATDDVAYNAVSQVYFCASNQSGTSTITVTATDADGVITTIGSRTISYYGDVATLEVTQVLSVARSAGGTIGDATAQRIATTGPTAFKVVVKDSAGQLVSGVAAGLSATPTTTIGSVTCAEDIYDTGTVGAYGFGGKGNYGCTLTSTALAASGGTGTVEIRHLDPADSAKYIVGTKANVTFGGSPSTVTMTFDKPTYAAGSTATLTVNVKDSAGNNAYDGVQATLFSGASTTNVTGSTPGAAVVVVGGKATYSVFMPNGAGTASVSNTLGASIAAKAGTTVSVSVPVTDGNAALLTQIDALNAKIVALNALIAKIMKRLGVK